MSGECEACGTVAPLRAAGLCANCATALETHRMAFSHLQALYQGALAQWLTHWRHEPDVLADAPHLAQRAGMQAADELEAPPAAKHRC